MLSQRRSQTIDTLYALVVTDDTGMEGILRRDTPYGTMPWISDDGVLLTAMREEACAAAGIPESFVTVARFTRATRPGPGEATGG